MQAQCFHCNLPWDAYTPIITIWSTSYKLCTASNTNQLPNFFKRLCHKRGVCTDINNSTIFNWKNKTKTNKITFKVKNSKLKERAGSKRCWEQNSCMQMSKMCKNDWDKKDGRKWSYSWFTTIMRGLNHYSRAVLNENVAARCSKYVCFRHSVCQEPICIIALQGLCFPSHDKPLTNSTHCHYMCKCILFQFIMLSNHYY